MSAAKTNGGPAFPGSRTKLHGFSMISDHQNGMSLRDYFAGQALVGMMANYTTAKFGCTEQQVAIGAYAYADAMLAAKTAEPIAL